ncbi:DUF177 domain-containing protein [Chloroflexi bacterium]|nr:DUF177 domain-containing protein [Chloroflexota bacterium]
MDFKVSTLLKSSSGTKRLENINGSFEANWTRGECGVDGSALLIKTDVGIWVSAHLLAAIKSECGSCLEEYKETVNLHIEEEYFPQVNLLTGDTNELEGIDENGFHIQENNVLDLSDAIVQYISLQSPISHKCIENCRGLCMGCGVNLNNGNCDCGPDKRKTKLMTLLKPFTVKE